MNDLTNVTTGEVRLSYCHLFKPYAAMAGQDEKYSVTVLVPKTDLDTMNRISAAIEAAKQRGISEKWNGQCPPIVPTPVHDGDGVRPSDGMEFGAECKGHWVFTASAKADYPPEVVDAQGSPVINQSEVYSGMYGKVNVNFFPYSVGGKKGVGCGLGPVMKTRDGEALGGSAPTAAQVFGFSRQQPYAHQQPQTAPYAYQQPQTAPYAYQQPRDGALQAAQQAAPTRQVNPITGMPM
ncbi:MAG: DUF2815 family protein [Dorea sp.]|jgi:hypothetical protein|nr:DUF2815 family protein [Dorea sp.]MCI9453215.1 DUF2815 family protein [Dorea sp.]